MEACKTVSFKGDADTRYRRGLKVAKRPMHCLYKTSTGDRYDAFGRARHSNF
jgi:hypothetical protein